MEDDPLDRPEQPKFVFGTPCPKCGNPQGHGHVEVTEAYVERHAPWPDQQALGIGDGEYTLLVAEVAARRSAVRNTVYPCRVCNTDLFFRWAEGHLSRGHDSSVCADCIEASIGSGFRRKRKKAMAASAPPIPQLPERRDVD